MFASDNTTLAYRATKKLVLDLPVYKTTDTLPNLPDVDNGSMIWVQDVAAGTTTLKTLQNGKWVTFGG